MLLGDIPKLAMKELCKDDDTSVTNSNRDVRAATGIPDW